MVNGIASLIAAIGLLLIPTADSLGYKGFWYLLVISTILSIVFLSPIVVTEVLHHEIPMISRTRQVSKEYALVPSLTTTTKMTFTER